MVERAKKGQAVLEAQNVTKVFRDGGEEVSVLRGVSLSLKPGEIVLLEGPSGSGKTTLLTILGCLLTPTSGKVVVDGQLVDSSRPELLSELRRRSLGFVFQHYNLFPSLTALENVAYALNIKGVGAAESQRRAESYLEQVGLKDRKNFLPRDLSGGQKQRVALARALAGKPAVLLADEPTANLDSTVGAQVLELLKNLAKKGECALLMVAHDPRVRAFCDRILSIRDGRLVTGAYGAAH